MNECIRCHDAPATCDFGFCFDCVWDVRVEFEGGFHRLREYLRAWNRFATWCEQRGEAIV